MNSFASKATLTSGNRTYTFFRLPALEVRGFNLGRLPFSLKILLENLLRREDGVNVTAAEIEFLANWDAKAEPSREIAYMPARVLMQDFTGVPAVVDLGAMRDAIKTLGGDPERVNPLVPAELVIDHSVQVDEFGTAGALADNTLLEFQRNRERYAFLKWGQTAFRNFSAVPPGMGICHQVNLEYLARVVFTAEVDGEVVAYPDTVVGTDSHTTSHGALGAFAFGIGATEMASVWALGTALNVEVPGTILVEVEGEFGPYVGPKDLILHLIGLISAQGANFKVIEFHGRTIRAMSTSGRLVLCNMSVEAGATAGIVPADEETDRYLRDEAGVESVQEHVTADPGASYSRVISIDVSSLVPQVACPHAVDNVRSVREVAGTSVQQIVIGSCTNGRLDDLEVAAGILRGKKVARGTRMLVFPASGRIYAEALRKGFIADFMNSGAVVMNPGCGPCLGVHEGALGDNETALSTTNRNFKGRMGNPSASVYLCSPAVAAASALEGVITDPTEGRN